VEPISSTTRSEPTIVGLVAFLVALAASLVAPAGRAAETDEATARILFVEGRKLAAGGDYAQACSKFEASYRLDPGIGTNFNLADCLEHTGRIASAWAHFLDVVAATRAANQNDRELVARARASALEPRLPRLVVNASAPILGLTVRRDGIPLPETSWGTAVPVDPGEHVIEATAPGKKTWSTTLTVAATPDTTSLSVPELENAPTAKPPALAMPSAPDLPPSLLASQTTPPSSSRHVNVPLIVSGSIGVVGLTTGAIFALKFRSDNDQAKGLCANDICGSIPEKTHHDTLVSSAYTDRTVALVSAGVGGAALLAAAYFWWRPLHPRRGASARAESARFDLQLASTGSWTADVRVPW
jgi:hypothetical protein